MVGGRERSEGFGMDARLRDRLSALALLARSSLAVFGRGELDSLVGVVGRVVKAEPGRQAGRQSSSGRRRREGGEGVW